MWPNPRTVCGQAALSQGSRQEQYSVEPSASFPVCGTRGGFTIVQSGTRMAVPVLQEKSMQTAMASAVPMPGAHCVLCPSFS